jgi:hypothetical protein
MGICAHDDLRKNFFPNVYAFRDAGAAGAGCGSFLTFHAGAADVGSRRLAGVLDCQSGTP